MKIKHVILNLLYKKDIMRTMHNNLQDALVGVLMNEYNGYFPDASMLRIKPPSILRAIINMLISSIIHHFTKDLIEEVVDTVLENKELLLNYEEKENAL